VFRGRKNAEGKVRGRKKGSFSSLLDSVPGGQGGKIGGALFPR